MLWLYDTGFDAHGSFLLSVGRGFGKNFTIFGADISSFMHFDNKKKDILILGKGLLQGILTAGKRYSINFTKQ